MPFFKVVLQFTQTDRGFTEIYYREAANIAAASTFDSVFVALALFFRNELTVLRKIRVSDVLNNRSSQVVNINQGAPIRGQTADLVSCAAIYTLNAPSISARRQVWFRGLQDNDVLRDLASGVDRPSGGLLNTMDQFVSRLGPNGFNVRALTRLTGAPFVSTPITAITVAGPGQITLNVPNSFVLTTSKRIVLSQFNIKQFPGLNGHWLATFVSPTTYTIPYNSLLANATYPLTKGRSRPEEYVYGLIDRNSSNFNKFSSRDTGRNPLGGRGRRSTPRIRSA